MKEALAKVREEGERLQREEEEKEKRREEARRAKEEKVTEVITCLILLHILIVP